MILERDNFIRSMRSEIYRKEYRNDTERIDLQTQLIQKDKVIKDLEVRRERERERQRKRKTKRERDREKEGEREREGALVAF